jgi:ADP-heptose:LPS heptosyltransferase
MALRRNVLIFHAGALGDFVLTWPLALAMGRLYPQSRILYVVPQQKGLLAQKALRVESVDVETGWHHLHADATQLPGANKRWLDGAHTLVSFISSPEDAFARNVRKLAPEATLLTLRPNPPEGFVEHTSQNLLAQLREWPAIGGAFEQILRSLHERGVGLLHKPGADVVVHPGSGSPAKCFPLDRSVELIRRLKADGRSVRVLLGEVERERWSKSEMASFGEVATIRTPATPVDLLNELSTAAALVANDSGPAHLGGLIGVPTLVLFSPTDPAVWRPIGPKVKAIRTNTWGDLTADAVYSEFNAFRTA